MFISTDSLFLIHTNVMDMEASVLSLSLLALRMVPSIVDTAVQINNAFVVSLSVNSLQQISDYKCFPG